MEDDSYSTAALLYFLWWAEHELKEVEEVDYQRFILTYREEGLDRAIRVRFGLKEWDTALPQLVETSTLLFPTLQTLDGIISLVDTYLDEAVYAGSDPALNLRFVESGFERDPD